MLLIPLLILLVQASRIPSLEAGSTCDCSSFFTDTEEQQEEDTKKERPPPPPALKLRRVEEEEEEADSDIIYRPEDLLTPSQETVESVAPELNFNFTTDSDITYRPDDLITPEQEIGPMRGLRFYPFSVDYDWEEEDEEDQACHEKN